MLRDLTILWTQIKNANKSVLTLLSALLLFTIYFGYTQGLPFIKSYWRMIQIVENIDQKIQTLPTKSDVQVIINTEIEKSENRSYTRDNNQWSTYFKYKDKLKDEPLLELIKAQSQDHRPSADNRVDTAFNIVECHQEKQGYLLECDESLLNHSEIIENPLQASISQSYK